MTLALEHARATIRLRIPGPPSEVPRPSPIEAPPAPADRPFPVPEVPNAPEEIPRPEPIEPEPSDPR